MPQTITGWPIESRITVRVNATGTYRALVTTLYGDFLPYAIQVARASGSVAGGLEVSARGNDVELIWSEYVSSMPVSEYLLAVGRRSGAADVGLVSLGRPSFTTGLARAVFRSVPTGQYFVRVLARTTAGLEPASVERSFTTTTGPNGLSALVFPIPGSNPSVELAWFPPATGTPLSYELLVGSAPGLSDLGIYSVGAAPFVRVRAVPHGVYYLRVRAVTLQGHTEPSNEVVVKTF